MDEATIIKACRIICAKTRTGFCKHVGGDLGCKVGRGTSDPEQCVASVDQHILAGNWETAEAVLELAKAYGEGRYSEGVHDAIQGS